jgi:cytidylate kinase
MPIVTVSRMFGAGGSEVAARIAELLGFPLLDNAVVEAVAARLGVTRAAVEAREERVPSMAERLADALLLEASEVVTSAMRTPPPFTEERMLEVTKGVIEEAVANGPVVLVGRGAQSMLGPRVDAVHIFCYAPRSALIARVTRRDGIPAAAAEKVVDETNRRREQYVKRYWGRSWLAHENYHLCVNTDWLGIEESAKLAADVARRRLGLASKV